LIVELDGSQHQQQVAYDLQRTGFLEQAGYRVIRFWDNDVLMKTDNVMQAIYEALVSPHPNPLPASPRGEGAKCTESDS
jgi:very-short-patch-repair endonuclease